nr:4-hydroxythreonine-4-phosphate dehydrogenase PdxA [Blochmannia endosymbiont of Camponotus (Colobopsis) obliquus]
MTKQLINDTILILIKNLKKYFNIPHPTIYVCGLNSHAEENGYIGTKEIEIIILSLNLLRSQGHNLIGPLSADTIFHTKYLKNADAISILIMYHNQGLPILKYNYFCSSVNITLGLPFIQTSVDHDIAIKLSWFSGIVQTKSMKIWLLN